MQPETLFNALEHGIAIILSLASGIPQAESQVRPEPDSWSVLEVICHLYDEEREDFRQRIDITLHRPQEAWPPIDPQGWVSSRKYHERSLAEILDQLAAERSRSLAWLRQLAAAGWEAPYQAHFGPIQAGDLLAAWAQHDSLHIRQLVELRYARINRAGQPYSTRYAGEW